MPVGMDNLLNHRAHIRESAGVIRIALEGSLRVGRRTHDTGTNFVRLMLCGIVNGVEGKASLHNTRTKERLDGLVARVLAKIWR